MVSGYLFSRVVLLFSREKYCHLLVEYMLPTVLQEQEVKDAKGPTVQYFRLSLNSSASVVITVPGVLEFIALFVFSQRINLYFPMCGMSSGGAKEG